MIHVYYWGGYGATQWDVDAWKQSLEFKRPDVEATVFPYPAGATAGDPLSKWEQQSDGSAALATRIVDGRASEQVIVVGHSSGCKIANDVAKMLLQLAPPGSFALRALDGFVPSPQLLALRDTQVWSARNGRHYSLNYHSCADAAGPRFHVYEADDVEQTWPLHFSLVNYNVSDKYSSLAQGYHNCDANLIVLGLEVEVT